MSISYLTDDHWLDYRAWNYSRWLVFPNAAGVVIDGIITSVVEFYKYHTRSVEERRYREKRILWRSPEEWMCVDTLGHELMYRVVRVEVFSFKDRSH